MTEPVPGTPRAAPAVTRMASEIAEIPDVVARVLREGAAETERVARLIERRRPRLVMVAARGTSDHAGIYARYLIETTFGWPVGLAASSVTTVYGARLDWRDILLIAISQSGAGPDIAAVIEAARRGGATTVALTNEPDSPIAAIADGTLFLHAGPELAVAATKTYVASLTAIAALAGRLAPEAEWAPALASLPDATGSALEEGRVWLAGAGAEAVAAFARANEALVVSRGHNFATALELALKLKETGRVFADGYSSADFLHGPVALAGPGVPTLVPRPDGPVGASIDEALEVAERAGVDPWIIGADEVAGRPRALTLSAPLPEPLTPLAFIVPGLLLVEAVARARGMDPDAPPGLSKVTRTL
ncbi:MAG: SIS domain-containing protein [Chloroflexota bacterium]